MKIGIGVTNYKRPDMLNKFLAELYDNTTYDHHLVIATDTDDDRKGIAFRKNECLRALKDCDHIFLFDDDCYPIKKGWEDYFINSGYNHLLYLNASHNHFDTTGELELYKDCGGVFMYMTKGAVERVGAFNEEYKLYSFEHAEYSIRILGEHGIYPMLKDTGKYIYAEDYSNPNHKSSITDLEKTKLIRQNFPLFIEGTKLEYLPL